MKMPKLMVALVAAAGVALAGGVGAQAMNKDARKAAYDNADAQFKTDKAACSRLKGNAKDVCMEEAKGKQKVARAEADAAYKNTPAARESARVAHVDADYSVAKEKCDDLSGNAKDACVKDAKARYVSAKADAKADSLAGIATTSAGSASSGNTTGAATDRRDADYRAAVEKCDAMTGAAKDRCVRDAKARYARS